MQSLPKTFVAGTACLLFSSPLLFLLLLGSSSAQGASLREHRLRGSEPDLRTGAPYQGPNADMLKALEYIENLRQRSGIDAQQQAPHSPESDDNDMDDAENLRTVLSLASPTQSQGQAGQDEKEEEEREEKEEDGEEEEEEEDKTQEWLQAVLSTLQQTEESPKPSLARSNTLSKGQRSTAMEDAHPWARQQHGTRSHRNHPLMFHEDEEGKGEGQEQGRVSDHDSPFKRTNENVEEKYTPQNMATLQSVFEELGRLSNAKAGHKRQIEEDENEDDDDDDDGDDDGDDDDDDDGDDDNELFNVRNLAYEDVTGGEEWAPLEEEEEEEDRDRQEFNRGLDYGNDEEGEDDEDEDTYPVKRSSQSGPRDDPDDITKLVDYYLLKVLEKTEEEQKRELEEEEEEEEERAERRVAQSQYRDKIDPHAIYQLLQISQKLQIPPEDLLGLLTTEEIAKQDRTLSRGQTRRPNELSRVKDKLSQKNTRPPPAKLYNRRLPDTHISSIPDDFNTEEILNILGLGNHNSAPLKKQKLHTSFQSRFYAAPDRLKNYDDGVDEDELAAYLAAQMLARYPQPVYNNNNKAGQKRASLESASREEDGQLGSFEQAIQDYLDQMDSVKSPAHKRQSETGSMGGAPQTQSLDDTALLKILSYLNPENEESDDKTVEGM